MLTAMITPGAGQGEWLSLTEILKRLQERFPKFKPTGNIFSEMGRSLKAMHVEAKHTSTGNLYNVRFAED